MNHGTPATDQRENGSRDLDDPKPLLRIWEAIDEIHRGQATTLRKLGELKAPVWIGVLAWVALVALEAWARLHPGS